MAFDQGTRNRLQKFVSVSRELLSEELTRQLQAIYGLDPRNGTIARLDELTHLDNRQRQTAQLLREILQHYIAATPGKNDKDKTLQALDRLVREQAFTVLNRMAALRMAEARGVLMESIGQGYNSRGFQLYKMLAGSSQGETGDAYRNYLFSLFDEFSIDLELLFDRHSAQGRLFPREAALLELLEQINHPEIEHLWGEDETIGWIYQYFNSQEERKKMRAESQAPRNSRELAVRNQFFTPRYVVEFLVDNTLGRIWFDASAGQTSLYDRCQYLLVKPEELDAKRAEAAPRTLRDPRTLKLLDPACGSMHFGLYAFDLFLEIYREAWQWEQHKGPGSLDVSTQPEAGLKPLSQTYRDEAAYLRDVPRLIIEHNIYGVDIDPRAAQIATLALWLRAQRAWHDADVKAQLRPVIGQGHVVAAIAPPAEKDLRQQFAARLDSQDAELFEKTLQLLHNLPELGVLLQVEQELPKLIKEIYGGSGTGLFADQEQETWQQAEQRLRQALIAFTEQASGSYQGRLFALDALQGLRLIDLTREKFDVVVMNPPFGAPSKSSKGYIDRNFSHARNDLLCVFIDRSVELLNDGGLLGCITSRTVLFLTSFSEWRESTLLNVAPPLIVADLGHGVLDAAMVETAAYCLKKNSDSTVDIPFIRLGQADNRNENLKCIIKDFQKGGELKSVFRVSPSSFNKIPGSPFSYWVGEEIRNLFKKHSRFESDDVVVRVTNPTADNFRYLRNYWECVSKSIGENGNWVPYAKGGSSKRYYYDVNLLAMWDPKVPTYKGYLGTVHRTDIRPASLDYFFKPGIMWPLRAPRMSAQAFPEGTAFSARSQCLFADKDNLPYFLGLMNSSTLDYLFKAALGRTDFPEFIVGVLRNLPKPALLKVIRDEISDLAVRAAVTSRKLSVFDEIDRMFFAPRLAFYRAEGTLADAAQACILREEEWRVVVDEIQTKIDSLVFKAYELSSDAISEISRSAFIGQEITDGLDESEVVVSSQEDCFRCLSESKNLLELGGQLFSWLIGCAFGRWNANISISQIDEISKIDLFGLQSIAPLPALLKSEADLYSKNLIPILVDDSDSKSDIIQAIVSMVEDLWGDDSGSIEIEFSSFLQVKDLRSFLRKVNGFFEFHLQQYSKSGRKAPIYWPLATPSMSYTLWIYYPELNGQTLFTAVNDFIEPKLEKVREDLNTLRAKGSSRSKQEEKQLEALDDLEQELADLRDTLLEIAPGYRPNQDDGVQISAAPLWSLFRHKPWQKVLKDTWKKLEKGDYDWAHLALNYWPERVLRKCHADRSLAIAHDVEDNFWDAVEVPVSRRGKETGETKLEWQQCDLSEPELRALIQRIRQERGL
ncbi:BREX-1 system adenine-specific DNA-methyltransferase PglX [Marinobacterium sedimentorum]|uniref:BREX-1 system adenine-specific DNA-methyltransferase PglX n=1 Tax=Marinobacterium sedimentorum TaxID=2927804 RepID=UPI0020C6A08A|nr:BREX-1 system adenine-specific DNA-methyltransferase PglX [Marinobacterium sedimentorum]MCP8687151.1 BREX-1 system adenine-specific DNA-methyltransferase PglX [Marinobacterium sedimentorum]